MKKFKKILSVAAACGLVGASALTFAGCSEQDEVITLRVCSWEEYIDLGSWKDDERITLDNGEEIFGENAIYDEFAEWFNGESDFGFKVKVEYSTFGTNEDLYNRLSLGDVYDLVCPSDYMIMKLLAEDKIQEYSDDFKNGEYATNVSPYIKGIFTEYGWEKYAACYMWGTTGIVYNPDKIKDDADVSTWNILLNEDYKRQVTIKDNVRDAYFAALGIINSEQLTTQQLDSEHLTDLMNATDSETIAKAEDVLKRIKDNVYSFETDSGKADMVTGKVIANYQWSGDAITILDGADADGTELWYSVPDECANLWFDGWVMLKSGIDGNEKRQTAAEAFVNYLSRPKNAVRNMYYIGYTSAIAGDTVFEYLDWTYGAEDDADENKVLPYDVSYFFGEDGEYIIDANSDDFAIDKATGEINRGRQLFAQYPPENVKSRSVVMRDFEDKLAEINQMWINVRCLDVTDISPVTIGVICGAAGLITIASLLYAFRYKLFIKYKPKKGFSKVEE
ncbi:MAG: ABC transporter substrate-binding protein [Clostridia bacterium]|nr:ABC transporter substrate-binding protein [Clostridia bacterium]